MNALRDAAESTVVTNGRGAEIQRRLDELGISDREWHEQTGIDRKTLRRAVEGQERVRPSTYAAIEAALDRLEAQVAGPTPKPIGDPGDDLVEFTITGNFGVRAVVKGPVRDMDELLAAVDKLMGKMGGADVPKSGDAGKL